MKKTLVWVAVGASLAAPSLAVSPKPPENQRYSAYMPQGEDTCGAQAFLDNLLQDPHYLYKAREMSKDDPKLRVLFGNQPMTMDLRPDRLTVSVDQEAQTIKMSCT